MKHITRIDCRKCRHYFVTWEPSQPHGCRAMGFKSQYIPSTVVYQNSQCTCRAYAPKTTDRSPQGSNKKMP